MRLDKGTKNIIASFVGGVRSDVGWSDQGFV